MLKTYTSLKNLKVCVYCTILYFYETLIFFKIKIWGKSFLINIQITHWFKLNIYMWLGRNFCVFLVENAGIS